MVGVEHMNDVILEIAKKTNMHPWWVESIAIEYTDCRDYALNGKISVFNFSKLDEDDLMKAVTNHKIVIRDTWIHNISNTLFVSRLLDSSTGEIPVMTLAPDKSHYIPEGIVPDNAFILSQNDISLVDPKLGLSRHFMVYDEGDIWQWEFADFVEVEGRGYGKWTSSHVNLDEFDKNHYRLQELYKLRNNTELYRKKIKKHYEHLNEIRQQIFLELIELHHKKKRLNNGVEKNGEYPIHRMSRYETYNIVDSKVYSMFLAEAIFYRELIERTSRSKKASLDNEIALNSNLDRIYQDRAMAIVSAAMCLEAYVNGIGFDMIQEKYLRIERKPIKYKIQELLKLKEKLYVYNDAVEPFKTMKKIFDKRNSLMHYKQKSTPALLKGDVYITSIGDVLDEKLIDKLEITVKDVVDLLCSELDLTSPNWII